MDKVAKLLDEIAQLGGTFAADNGQLRLSGPKGMLTSELQRRIADSKDEIVRRLQQLSSANPVHFSLLLDPDPLGDSLAFPLSDLQLGFYIANDSYMEFHVRPHCYYEFDDPGLDPVAYQAAWNKALKRHRRELCTVTKEVELKLLSGGGELQCQVYDLRSLASQEAACRLLAVREQMQRQELPLDTWPWIDLRASLWNENGREMTRIHYNHNSFFLDGFGTTRFLHEIDEYYADPNLTYLPLAPSYRDAILALNRLAESEQGQAAYHYWSSRLPTLPSPPNLPQKAGFNRRCRSHMERREEILEKHLWDAFKGRATALGITPSNAVIAAYSYVIATWSNSDHFILSQMATRRFAALHPDLPRMLGNFVSLYPLEVTLAPSAPFAENAQGIQRQVIEDLKHLQVGGMRVLQELNHLKGSFGAAPSPFVVGSGLALKKYKKPSFAVLETSQTILDHQFFELEDGGCHFVWDLQEAFFPEGAVNAMWDAFTRLLHLLACHGSVWQQNDFPLVDPRDLQVRRERNKTAEPMRALGLHEVLGAQASCQGQRTVLISAEGVLSYDALSTESDVLSAELRARSVNKGELVPVVMDRGREFLVAVSAILKCGAAYVPIDPRFPPQRLALLLADIGSRLVLTESKYAGLLAWHDDMTILTVSLNGSPAQMVSPEVTSSSQHSDLAYVIYTSGSTGTPKGVMISHGGALNTILDINRRFNVGPDDKLFGVSEIGFDLSVYDIFGAFAAGACLVYPDPELARDPTHWLELMLRERVTIWSSAPALMRLWIETAERRGVQVPSLRLVLLSGDKIPLDLPAAIRLAAPNAKIVSLGGATEASIWSILYPIEHVEPTWSTIPYGFPMANQRWYVRDRNGKDCPTWVPGELLIAGAGLALGYWNDAEKTKRSFEVDRLSGERLYHTGDLGRYLPDGSIEWMGRIDFQVKVNGQRVELGEIEAVLAQHPTVDQAVVAVEEANGRGEPRLVGYIVPKISDHVEWGLLESFLEDKLPAHMIPTAWRKLERLPITVNGKIDRKSLLSTYSDPDSTSPKKREYIAPQNEVEQKLQEIWQSTLGLPTIGVADDFFELGGQSFDAIRIFALIKERFGWAYTLGDIWRARTIRELAKGRTDPEEKSEGSDTVVPINLHGTGQPLFLVHPAGGSVMTYSQLGELINRPLYGIQALPGMQSANRPPNIHNIARHYTAELRRQQPSGPYSVGGWSSGAMIAFEIAAQLEAAGEYVQDVFLLDGPAPVTRCDGRDETLWFWFLQDLGLTLPIDRLNRETFTGLKPEEQLRKAVTVLESHGVFGLDAESLTASFGVFQFILKAGNGYKPTRISSDLTVIRVEQDIVDEFSTHPSRDESDWGWSRFTTGQVRCMRVPGTHYTFLKQPLLANWCHLFETANAMTLARP